MLSVGEERGSVRISGRLGEYVGGRRAVMS